MNNYRFPPFFPLSARLPWGWYPGGSFLNLGMIPRRRVPATVWAGLTWAALSSLGLVTLGVWPVLAQASGVSPGTLSPGTLPPVAFPSVPLLAQNSSPLPVARPDLSVGDRRPEVVELQAVLQLLGFYDGAIDGIYGETTRSSVAIFQQIAGLDTTGTVTATTWNRLFPATVPPGTPLAASSGSRNPVAANPAPVDPSTAPSAATFPVPPSSSRPPSPPVSSSPPAVSPVPRTTTAPAPAEVSLPVLKEGARGSVVEQLQTQLDQLGFYSDGVDGVFGEQTTIAVKKFQEANDLEKDGVVGPATWAILLRRGQ